MYAIEFVRVSLKLLLYSIHMSNQQLTQTEFEYKFINIDLDSIIKKLEELGAVFKFDTVYKIYNHDRIEWRPFQGRLRLREGNGKVTMAYKAKQEDGFDSEVEFEIEDIEKAHELVNAIGIPLKRFEQKRRISYELDGVSIDIDFWPDIDPYIEIEADSEDEIRTIVEKLGLDFSEGLKLNSAEIYKLVSGKDIGNDMRFAKDDWRLTVHKRS